MAGPGNKRTARAVLDALSAGQYIAPNTPDTDPDAERFHPAEDFALAWLRYWRDIGNHVLPDNGRCAFMCAEMAGLNDEVPQPQLPPHQRLWNNDMRAGAQRAMEIMLDTVPGGRDALRKIVMGRDNQ